MSTTFAVETINGEKVEVAQRHGIGNGKVQFTWLAKLHSLLPDSTPVIPIDNTAQGIETIGDIRKAINQPELKPCPFCGGEVQIIIEPRFDNKDAYKIICTGCEMGNPDIASFDRDRLIKDWGMRVDDPRIAELEKEIEAIKKEVISYQELYVPIKFGC